MTKRMVFVSLILYLTACVSVLALGSAADAYSAGAPGDDNETARSILITMQEVNSKMLFNPALIEVKKGQLIKFVLRNDGALEHEFVLARRKRWAR